MKQSVFNIGDNIMATYLRLDEKYGIASSNLKKVYTVADSPLSYRQINELSKTNVLKNDRLTDRGWRKFSFIELVFLNLLAELKGYGVRHSQLAQLKDVFFKQPEISEWSIGCALLGVEIILTVHPNGDVSFYDPANYSLMQSGMTGTPPASHILISLNRIINNIRGGLGLDKIPITKSIAEDYIKNRALNLTLKEEQLLKIVRDSSYKTLRIKKKDGGTLVINAERSSGDNITGADFAKLLKERDYQVVTATSRDGRVVNLKVEETIKL